MSINKEGRRSDDVRTLREYIGSYINFSDSIKFGMRYFGGQYKSNPLGIYGIKLTSEMADLLILHGESEKKHNIDHKLSTHCLGFHRKKLINIFNVSDIVDIDKESKLNEKIYSAIESKYGNKIKPSLYYDLKEGMSEGGNSYLGLAAYILESAGLVTNNNVATNILLRLCGYRAIETNSEFFKDGFKHQVVVLDPGACNLICTIQNPYYGREYRKSDLGLEISTEGLWEKKKRLEKKNSKYELLLKLSESYAIRNKLA